MTSMGDVVPYRSPHASEHTTAYIGMIIFVGAWAMMFACLFFAYGALRIGSPFWPPAGQPLLPLAVPGLNTVILIASSAALELGLYATRRGRVAWLAPGIFASALLGILFLSLQYFVGAELYGEGLKPDTGPYASVLYGLAGIHGVHVAIGLIALLWLTIRAARGAYNTPQHLPVRLWSIYWHFMGVVWVLMFIFVFVV